MTIEILNVFTKSNGKYSYQGQFQYLGSWVPLSGEIENVASRNRFKQMLREKIEAQISEYIEEHKPPKTFTIPIGGIFVNALS